MPHAFRARARREFALRGAAVDLDTDGEHDDEEHEEDEPHKEDENRIVDWEKLKSRRLV